MYAVIFKAEIDELDAEYFKMASQLQKLAITEYGCSEFTSVTEGKSEISISYWETQEQIRQWKQDTEHLAAQEIGKSKWYKSYQVQVVEIIREYRNRR